MLTKPCRVFFHKATEHVILRATGRSEPRGCPRVLLTHNRSGEPLSSCRTAHGAWPRCRRTGRVEKEYM